MLKFFAISQCTCTNLTRNIHKNANIVSKGLFVNNAECVWNFQKNITLYLDDGCLFYDFLQYYYKHMKKGWIK